MNQKGFFYIFFSLYISPLGEREKQQKVRCKERYTIVD